MTARARIEYQCTALLLWMPVAALIMWIGACTAVTSPSACAVMRPFDPSPDVGVRWTTKELAQLKAHNEWGEQHCGWHP